MRLYWPRELRPAFDALFAIDDVMAEIVASSTQPALGAIRLAWWREALERLDHHPPPPEPTLTAAALHLLPRGISGVALAAMEDGYASLLDEQPDRERLSAGGETLFAIGATLLGGGDPMLPFAGHLHAVARAARRGFTDLACGAPRDLASHRFPRALRPLTAFSCLAARDLARAPMMEAEATPGRAVALLAHRWSGRIGKAD